jgi:thymidylate kinase
MIIEIEGCDGVGKTTVSKMLAEKIGALYLKFPDRESPTGKIIDGILREKETSLYGMDFTKAVTFQALNVVNRGEKIPLLILASEDSENHVVCDRYEQSVYVYGTLDGLDRVWIQSAMMTTPEADWHVLLRMDPTLLDGARLAGRDREVYESEGVEGLRAQQLAFSEIWAGHIQHSNWMVFDSGALPAKVIVQAIANAVREVL